MTKNNKKNAPARHFRHFWQILCQILCLNPNPMSNPIPSAAKQILPKSYVKPYPDIFAPCTERRSCEEKIYPVANAATTKKNFCTLYPALKAKSIISRESPDNSTQRSFARWDDPKSTFLPCGPYVDPMWILCKSYVNPKNIGFK